MKKQKLIIVGKKEDVITINKALKGCVLVSELLPGGGMAKTYPDSDDAYNAIKEAYNLLSLGAYAHYLCINLSGNIMRYKGAKVAFEEHLEDELPF